MCMRLGAVPPGSRAVLIDDLIATGGTALSGFELCHSCGVEVYEFAAVIDIPFCEGVKKIRDYAGGRFTHVPIVTMVDNTRIGDDQGRDPAHWKEDGRTVPA